MLILLFEKTTCFSSRENTTTTNSSTIISKTIDSEAKSDNLINRKIFKQSISDKLSSSSARPYKEIEKTLIEHIISLSKNSEQHTTGQQQQHHNINTNIDDMLILMRTLLTRLDQIENETRETKSAAETSTSAKEIKPVRISLNSHRTKSQKFKSLYTSSSSSSALNDHSRTLNVAESVLSTCEAKVKTSSSSVTNEWTCELNADFDSADPRSEANLCTCTRRYECIEYEQYSIENIDEIEIDDEETHSHATSTCEAGLAGGQSDQQWKCTLSINGEGPNGEDHAYCDCQLKKKCDFQKTFNMNDLLSSSSVPKA